ncbi:MAG: PD-(D/E)XK nuclease family protein [Bryobacteraceae bacterium]|nr:PD-(D/E)XK nuclease family protein [Bryobacteraceae bacterium]
MTRPAPSTDREVHSLAARIVELCRSGERLSRIAVTVPGEHPYRALISSTFERYGIPLEEDFADRLEERAPVRYAAAVVEALLSGWDKRKLIDVVRLSEASPRLDQMTIDRIEFDLLAAIPGFGLDELGALAGPLAEMEGWRTAKRLPRVWAKAAGGLDSSGELRACLERVAEHLPQTERTLADFWDASRSAVAAARIRPAAPAGESVLLTAGVPCRPVVIAYGVPVESFAAYRPAPGPRKNAGHAAYLPAPPSLQERRWTPTELETFLKCPFQFFGQRTLRLQLPPKPPEERFGVLDHGTLAHRFLHEWTRGAAAPFEALFDRLFREICRKNHVTVDHHVEWHRLALERNLRRYLAQAPRREGWTVEAEWPFEFALRPDLIVKGQIDRFDRSPSGDVYAIDYKYSAASAVKNRMDAAETVQGGLYLHALASNGYRPAGFAYVALRGETKVVEASDPNTLMEEAERRAVEAVESIRAGRIAAQPSDTDICRWCDFRDACRIRETAAAAPAQGAGA